MERRRKILKQRDGPDITMMAFTVTEIIFIFMNRRCGKMDKEQITLDYYSDNAKRLRAVIDHILTKFGGISPKDYDDFYSLANEVFTVVLKTYDGTQKFENYMYSCLSNKIKTEITYRNRSKRKRKIETVTREGGRGTEFVDDVSMDSTVGGGEITTIENMIPSSFDLEKEVSGRIGGTYDDKIEKYLEKLSKRQREIVLMLSEGYKAEEIRGNLHLTAGVYSDCMRAIQSYSNIKILL